MKAINDTLAYGIRASKERVDALTADHAGQISTIRRSLGRPPLF